MTTKRFPFLPLTLLCLSLLCACVPPKKEDGGDADGQPTSACPLAGTSWQGLYVSDSMSLGDERYCGSTFYAMTMDTATGLIHMTDHYYVNGTLSSNDTASLAFSYHFAGHSGMLTFVYQGDTSSCPFSVNDNMLTLSFLTFHKVL